MYSLFKKPLNTEGTFKETNYKRGTSTFLSFLSSLGD